jgi:hypothetical protein
MIIGIELRYRVNMIILYMIIGIELRYRVNMSAEDCGIE